tara:strand:+ start:5408 stop:6751 length:1344 start_codon:yes stop_codon:yes gene_type:complete
VKIDIEIHRVCDTALNIAMASGANDVSIVGERKRENMIRFSNNTVTVVKTIETISIQAYVGVGRRRMIGVSSNVSQEGIRRFVTNLIKACRTLEPSSDYVALPSEPFRYGSSPAFDKLIIDEDTDLVDIVKQSINAAIDSGAKRASGSLLGSDDETAITTSAGAHRAERSTSILLSLRAFAEKNASGHGLSCSANLSGLDAAGAGKRAGQYAKRALNPHTCTEGKYDLILTPTVAADIFQHIGEFASAFYVDLGVSFFGDMIGKTVARDSLNIRDRGVVKGGFGGRSFDDEGLATRETYLVENGQAKNLLHNNVTSKKFATDSTGNAGIIDPHPWNIIVDEGDQRYEELVKDTKRGIIVTNNWYTRFQDMRSGQYSTLPRDAAFMIENGEITSPISGIRISDNIPRQLREMDAITRGREWIYWWEVRVPTLTPAIRLRNVPVTRAST